MIGPKTLIAMLVAVVLALGVTYKLGGDAPRAEIARLNDLQAEAKRATAVRAAQELKNKERTDEENRNRRGAADRELARLRDELASRPLTPAAPPATSRPDLICFDRAEFDRALREFEGEAAEIAGAGAACTVDLDSAKGWARGD